jgi:hypothetical protein
MALKRRVPEEEARSKLSKQIRLGEELIAPFAPLRPNPQEKFKRGKELKSDFDRWDQRNADLLDVLFDGDEARKKYSNNLVFFSSSRDDPSLEKVVTTRLERLRQIVERLEMSEGPADALDEEFFPTVAKKDGDQHRQELEKQKSDYLQLELDRVGAEHAKLKQEHDTLKEEKGVLKRELAQSERECGRAKDALANVAGFSEGKITFQWLMVHVPITWWFILGGAIVSLLGAAVLFGASQGCRELLTLFGYGEEVRSQTTVRSAQAQTRSPPDDNRRHYFGRPR